ncbi:MAG TPA: nicotinate-nucleotide adenylyltransferase [Anaerolineales bacterium]|nr:nicotinate-nucleotide adenylyltransferase [Anaerolineales bacterium]
MRIGIFGGTFDPPHIGHLILADEARYSLDLDQVLFVLTPNPPHKKDLSLTPVNFRLEMLASALNGEPAFVLSRIDLDRSPPHYALDTVKLIRQNMPGSTLVYLMGGDSLQDLPTWHQPEEFVAACDQIGVMCRPASQVELPALELKIPGIVKKACLIEAPLLEISSSDIRRRVASGEPYRFYLTAGVWKIIHSKKLYQA